ncbi:MAG: hypothetical protein AAB250_07765, partial [Bdellovibrionota bacterium]
MSTRLVASFLATLFMAPVAMAETTPSQLAPIAANAGKSIVCEELGMNDETGEDVPLAKVTVRLGVGGKADRVIIARPKTPEMVAIPAMTLTSANATIKHEVT